MADQTPPPEIPEFGAWQTSCGPGEVESTFTNIVTFGAPVLGVACFLVPVLRPPAPGEDPPWLLFGSLGGLMLLIGAVLLVIRYCFPDRTQVHLYEQGVLIALPKEEHRIDWTQITKLKLVKVWEDRFSNYTRVIIEPPEGEPVEFSSKLKGDAETIVEAVTSHAQEIEYDEYSMG